MLPVSDANLHEQQTLRLEKAKEKTREWMKTEENKAKNKERMRTAKNQNVLKKSDIRYRSVPVRNS